MLPSAALMPPCPCEANQTSRGIAIRTTIVHLSRDRVAPRGEELGDAPDDVVERFVANVYSIGFALLIACNPTPWNLWPIRKILTQL